MRLIFWVMLSLIALGTITPSIFVITYTYRFLTYIGEKLANILLYIDDRLEYELNRQRLRDLARQYLRQNKD